MIYVDLVLRWMHVLGAITLMGGTIFARFALLPTLQGLSDESRREVENSVRAKWSKLVHLSIAFLLVSGLINMVFAMSRYRYEGIINTPMYHGLLGLKFLLGLVIFYVASILSGRSERAQKARENARYWVTLNLVLALIVVLIGGVLKLAVHTPKATSHNSTSQVSIANSPM